MARLLHPDGTNETVTPKDGKRFSLDELQGLVEGYIELVPGEHSDVYDVVVNEEGLLKELPFNLAGSLLAPGHHLVGNVLILDGGERLE